MSDKVYAIVVISSKTGDVNVSQEGYMKLKDASDFCQSRSSVRRLDDWRFESDDYTYIIKEISLPKFVHVSCDYCEDARFIERSGDIFSANSSLNDVLQQLHKDKKFVNKCYQDGHMIGFSPVECCPVCGHTFTEEDYDER